LGGFLYAIEEESGRIQWRFSAGEAIRKAVYVGSDAVFVVTELGEMSCVDREKGIARWRITEVDHFVAQSPTRVYVKDHFGRLLILDASTGNILTTIRMEPLKHLAANTVNDRIYLGTDRGLVQSLRESDLEKPVPLIEKVMEEKTAEVKTDAIEM